nr:citrate/2-methylcitrate synthase [Brevundimonas sp.]
MHTSLILYAGHEFNASTFTARTIAGTGSDMYSCVAGAIGALRGPKHGGANEVASKSRSATPTRTQLRPTSAAGSKPRKWSSASVTRSIRSPTPRTRSSSAWPAPCRRKPAR